jgi:LysM repeat protein
MDNNQESWSSIMHASVERKNGFRAPLLVGVVAGLHIVAVGAFLFIQGCGTTKVAVEPPPAPIMPPKAGAEEPVSSVMPRPVVQPPVAVEAAPTMAEGAGQTYEVASGDSLSKIAARFGVSAREITELNKIKDANKIRVGQKLLLPSYASPQAPSAVKKPAAKPVAKPAAKPKPAPVAGAGEYIVKSGDSLSKIASRNGTTVKALREANNLKSDMIRINQKLVLPGGAAAVAAAPAAAPAPAPVAAVEAPAPSVAPASAPAVEAAASVAPAPVAPPAPAAITPPAEPLASSEMSFEYVLKPGETLDEVAKQFAVLKQDIMTLNGISDAAAVAGGTRLKIPMASP